MSVDHRNYHLLAPLVLALSILRLRPRMTAAVTPIFTFRDASLERNLRFRLSVNDESDAASSKLGAIKRAPAAHLRCPGNKRSYTQSRQLFSARARSGDVQRAGGGGERRTPVYASWTNFAGTHVFLGREASEKIPPYRRQKRILNWWNLCRVSASLPSSQPLVTSQVAPCKCKLPQVACTFR